MQNTFSQSGNDSKWFSEKSFFRIGMWNSRPPPPFMEKNHLKFPFWLIEYSPYIAHKNYDASIMMSLTHYYNQILSNTNQCYQIQLDSQTLSESCQYVIACHVSPKKSIFHCNQASGTRRQSSKEVNAVLRDCFRRTVKGGLRISLQDCVSLICRVRRII